MEIFQLCRRIFIENTLSPLVPVTLSFGIGIGVSLYLCISVPAGISLCLLYTVILLFWKGFNDRRKVFLLVFCLGLLRGTLCVSHNTSAFPDGEGVVCLKGIILDPPLMPYSTEDKKNSVFLVRAQAIEREIPNNGKRWEKVYGEIRMVLEDFPGHWYRGDRIVAFGELFYPKPPTNPGQMDYQQFLEAHGIYRLMRIHDRNNIKVLERWVGCPVLNAISRLRSFWCSKLFAMLGQEDGAIAIALLLGERRFLAKDQIKKFQCTGTIHILAISGFHVSILALGLTFIARLLRLSLSYSTIFILVLVSFYALLTGLSTPVARAVLLVVIHFGALLLGRKAYIWNSLALCALIILMVCPNDIFSPSFELSFLACVGIISLYPAVYRFLVPENRLDRLVEKNYRFWFRKILGGAIAISVSPWIATFPMSLYYFNIITFLSIPANILLIPIMELVLVLGFLCLIIGQPFALLLKICLWAMDQGMILTCHLYFYFPSPSIAGIGVYYLCISFLALSIKWYKKLFLILVGTAVLFASLWKWDHSCSLKVAFLDVGQGSAVYIRLPDGKNILYDCGSMRPEVGEKIVAPFLWSERVASLDAIILSHSDGDHCNAVPEILERFYVKTLIVNRFFSLEGSEFLRQARERNVRIHVVQGNGYLPQLEGVLFMNPGDDLFLESNNQKCLVSIIGHKGSRILLAGDLQGQGLDRLIKFGLGRFDVLLVPHHGGYSLLTERLISAIEPKIAIISASSSFPDMALLKTYKEKEVVLYTTYDHGCITVIVSDEGHLRVDSFTPHLVKGGNRGG